MQILRKIYWIAYNHLTRLLCKMSPYGLGPALAQYEYRRIMGRRMDLKNPKNLIEKIVWMQFHTDTSLWTHCADKYCVRDFVKSKGLESILTKLYGKWDNADEVDFDKLPNSFVLKTNNSCGQNLIVRDKSKLDIEETRTKLNSWLKQSYGYHNAQLHYTRIKPCIIAEELLIDTSLKPGENLTDYKVWCFNGKPESILVISGRNGSNYNMVFYNTKWNNISNKALNHKTSHFSNIKIDKPNKLDDILKYASILSDGFPEVRVDFYYINDKIYFGEMTFTAGYGNYSDEYYNYLGSKVDLTKANKIR